MPYWINVTADPELDEDLRAWREAGASRPQPPV